MGITHNAHFCEGYLVRSSLSLGEEDLDCGMHPEKSIDHRHWQGQNTMSHPCCDEHHASYLVEGEWSSGKQFILPMQGLTASIYPPQMLPNLAELVCSIGWADRAPPLIVSASRLILFQVFRI